MPARTRKKAPTAPGRGRRGKRPITAEDLLTLKFVRGGSISPDGSLYAFTVESARKDRKGYDSHLYVAATDGSWVRQYSHGKRSDGSPLFSPDGSTIAFVSKRGKYPGIQLIPTDGGEARTLVERDGAFSELSFSPDGKHILCLFVPNDPPPDQDAKKGDDDDDPDADPPKKEAPVYRHITRLFYRLDGAGFRRAEEPQIWLFDVETGEGTQLTRGKRAAMGPAFSPDGKRIAFCMNIQRDPDVDMDNIDLFVISARGGRPRRVPTPPGPVSQPRFSPDGKKIAYLGHDDVKDPWYENPRVWVVPTSGRGAPARCTCPRFDQPAFDGTISDTGEGFFEMPPHWSGNGAWIYFMSCASGSSGLYRVRARGGTPELVTEDKQHLQTISLSEDRTLAAGIVSTELLPPEVYAFDLETGEQDRVTFLTREWTRDLDLQKPKHVRVRSTEGTRVDGWVLTPPKFNPRRRYPAIVEVHGGPMTQYGYTFFHEMQLLAAKGYVVYYSNPRGSIGYGRDFCEAIKYDWGNRDFADVMAGTDYLERLPYVNQKRIGITGGSYGGYMTNWAIGHTRRYKAAVTQRSVVDHIPFFGSSDVGYVFEHELGGFPWTNAQGYRRQSPLTYVEKMRTPLLIIHSENDLRCSIEQAENLFASLKRMRRTVEFIRFPEESHGLSRMGRPDRRLIRLNKIVDWFRRHL